MWNNLEEETIRITLKEAEYQMCNITGDLFGQNVIQGSFVKCTNTCLTNNIMWILILMQIMMRIWTGVHRPSVTIAYKLCEVPGLFVL